MSKTAKRLKEMGVVLPKPAAPVANYVPSVRAGSLLFVSGQLPLGEDGKLNERHQGKLSPNSEVDAAREAARLCVINVLAQAHAALGDLDKVKQVVRLGGFFNVEFELRRPAPSDERRVQFHRRTVRRSGPPCADDGWRLASAAQRAGRGRSRVRDRGLTPVNAPAWLVERPIAHRGLHDAAKGVIENTLRAAEAAIAGGFAIECDIQLSSDGEAIVFHDETLDRLTDASGPVSALERGRDRETSDQGMRASRRRPSRLFLTQSPAGPRSSASSRAGSTATGASPTAPPRSQRLTTARSRSRASTMISPPICVCAARTCGPQGGPARSASWPRRPTTIRLGFPKRRTEAGLDGFRPLRPRPPGFPQLERRRPPPQDPVPGEGIDRRADHGLDGAHRRAARGGAQMGRSDRVRR